MGFKKSFMKWELYAVWLVRQIYYMIVFLYSLNQFIAISTGEITTLNSYKDLLLHFYDFIKILISIFIITFFPTHHHHLHSLMCALQNVMHALLFFRTILVIITAVCFNILERGTLEKTLKLFLHIQHTHNLIRMWNKYSSSENMKSQ